MVEATVLLPQSSGEGLRLIQVDKGTIETMTTSANADLKRYGHLLAKTTPRVIKTDADNERMLAVVDKLMWKGKGKLTLKEDALLELLVDLIHDYEEKRYPIPKSAPHEMLSYLLDQKRLIPKDLWAVVE